MKTILISLVLIALVGSLAGGGLFAYFSDTEPSNGNTYQIGKLDMELNSNTTPIEAKPCQWFRWEVDLLNLTTDSNLKGHLSMKMDAPLPPAGTDPYVNEYWQGGAHPEPETTAGDANNSNNLKDCLEGIIVLDPYDAYGDYVDILEAITTANPIPKNFHEAKDLLDNLHLIDYTPWMGKISELTSSWKALGDIYPHVAKPRRVEYIVHLCETGAPQNEMQGDFVKINKTYYVQQFGCDEGPGGGKVQVLPAVKGVEPATYVSANIVYPGNVTLSYWKTMFSGIPGAPGDYCITNGVWYPTWCIDKAHTMSASGTYQVQLMSSLDQNIYTTSANWGYNPPIPHIFNYVNWMINQPGYHTGGGETNLQWAIWYFIDGVTYAQLPAGAQTMVDAALANGGDFVPEHGQNAVVVIFKMLPNQNSFQIVCFEADP